MIIYNEKVGEEAGASGHAHQSSPPTSPRTPASINTAGSPRPGLLHHYLQLHLNNPGITRRSSGHTEDELQEQPPPYTASLSDFPNPSNGDELAKLLPHSCPPISYSAIHSPFRGKPSQYSPPRNNANDGGPIAGPSTLPPVSPQRRTGDIEGAWVVSSDEDALSPPAQDQPAARSPSRSRLLETESGNIQASIAVEGSLPRRCIVEAATGSGSVDLHITRIPDSSRAKVHIKAKSEAFGHVAISMPSDFCGIVRLRRRSSSYLYQIQLDAPLTTFISIQYSNEGLGNSVAEYFLGDVVAAGYVKGMTDEEWRGDILEAEACDGSVTINAASRSIGFIGTLVLTLSPALAYLWSLCSARWWP